MESHSDRPIGFDLSGEDTTRGVEQVVGERVEEQGRIVDALCGVDLPPREGPWFSSADVALRPRTRRKRGIESLQLSEVCFGGAAGAVELEDALAAAEIAAASAVPFILFEDLPPEYQEELARHRDHALFIRYPPNRWGNTSIGTVMVRLRTPEGEEWLPLDPYHQPLLRRLAELTYLERVAEEERIDELIQEGQGTWYPDRESARAVQGSLTVRTEHRETGACVRTDPTTGETWMCPGLLVTDAPRLQRLREQRKLVASILLGGRSGGFSTGFRQK